MCLLLFCLVIKVIFIGVRDYIHIQDLADGHVKALEKILEKNFNGYKVYNLGTGQGHTVLEVCNKGIHNLCNEGIHNQFILYNFFP